MPEPLTLAAVGAVVLTEGVKFLYGQAGELLKRWQAKKDPKKVAEPDKPTSPGPIAETSPSVLEGQFAPEVIHFDRVPAIEADLWQLRRELGDYVDGLKSVTPDDPELLALADALRGLLEEVYGQHITFKGERREPSGTPVIQGRLKARSVSGEGAAVRIGTLGGGVRVEGNSEFDDIKETGSGYGVKIDKVDG